MDGSFAQTKRGVAMEGVLKQHSVASPAEVLRSLAAGFTRTERLVLMLRYTEELTVKEIAAVLELAQAEVEKILVRVRAHVVKRLRKKKRS